MFTFIINKLKNLSKIIGIIFSREYFGFVGPHHYLTSIHKHRIKSELENPNQKTIEQYENAFANLIGDGKGLSFAAGRMAFYSVMKVLGIKEGDEVILLGFTCSVMPNAILRIGAKPIYIDVDEETLGSLPSSVEKRISSKTKLIVAQHSFGIPCKINEIMFLAKRKKIFVLEDCAISLESSLDGISVGNWGDAAIFSTDHTKPLNTIIGGFLYSNNISLIEKVRKYHQTLPDLSYDHNKRIFKQFIFEMKYFKPSIYGFTKYINALRQKIRKNKFIFLEQDYSRPTPKEVSYPYPAKLPSFLAMLGLYEIEYWENNKKHRLELMNSYLQIIKKYDLVESIPKAYLNKEYNIIPHRFCFFANTSSDLRLRIKNKIDIDAIWFDKPIVCANDLIELEYKFGICQSSEKVSKIIINFPTNVDKKYHSKLVNLFEKEIHYLSKQLPIYE